VPRASVKYARVCFRSCTERDQPDRVGAEGYDRDASVALDSTARRPTRLLTAQAARARRRSATLPKLSAELLAVLGLQCLLIVPLQVASPWWSDDAINSSLRGTLFVNHESWFRAVYVTTKLWMLNYGRFYPLHYVTLYSQFYLFTDRVIYKLVLAMWCLVATAACWWMLREVGLSRAAAALVSLLAIASMQIRFYHDSLIDHAGLIPLTFTQLCVSLAFFDRWLRQGRRRQLVTSAIFLVWSLLTYETGYLFFVVFALVALRRRQGLRSALRASAVPIVIFVIVNVIAAGLRTRVPAGNGYAPNFAVIPIARGFVDQFTGALPFVYAFLFKYSVTGEYDLFGHFGRGVWTTLHPIDIVGGALVASLTLYLLKRTRAVESGSTMMIGLIGLAMWALAAAPIALATRYQQELTPGLAFLPVFLESFGLGIVAVSVVIALQRRFPGTARALTVVVAVGAGAFAALDHRANVITEHAMYVDATARRVLDARARELLAAVPQRARLVLDPEYLPIAWPGFFWQNAGKVLFAGPATPRALRPAGGPPTGCGPTSHTWDLRLMALPSSRPLQPSLRPGLYAVGCVLRAGGVLATRATLTVGAPGAVDITGRVFDDPARARTGYNFVGPVSQVFRRASRDDWLPPDGTDLTSLAVVPSVPMVVPQRGCYAPDASGRFDCQRHAGFLAENLGSSPQRVSIVVDVVRFATDTRSVSLTVNGQRQRVALVGRTATALILPPLLLRPGQRATATVSVDSTRLLDKTRQTVMIVQDARTISGGG
jgi:hypothetical protein